jgi:beta-xylosidase
MLNKDRFSGQWASTKVGMAGTETKELQVTDQMNKLAGKQKRLLDLPKRLHFFYPAFQGSYSTLYSTAQYPQSTVVHLAEQSERG